jgi:EPS-associated MarR family transcriptional regulator
VTTDETLEYQALRRLAEGPVVNQRSLAESLGVSLGKANYVIRALVARGWVTVENVSRNQNRIGFAYLLSRKGLTEKAKLTRRFLDRKVAEFEQLQQEIDILASEAGVTDIRTLAS